MANEIREGGGPTRRDCVKYGGAVVGGGLLAGCSEDAGAGSTPAETEAVTGTETAVATTSDGTTGADTSYDVEVEPYGSVTFDDVPETYVALGSGAWPDVGFAFAGEPVAMSKTYYPFHYYEALPGVSFDADAVADLGDVGEIDAEQFFVADADVHVIDKVLLAYYADWDVEDFERVEEEIGPFAGSYVRGEWSGTALGIEFSFPYYELPGAIALVGEVFQQGERARAWIDQLDAFTGDVAAASPDSSPDVGLIFSGSDPSAGEFYLGSPTAAGVGSYPYGILDASNGFETFTSDGTYQTDYEGLLEADPDYICVDSAISGLSTEEFESRFVEAMGEHPVGRELSAVKNGRVVRGCGRHQGPIVAHFEVEAMAKQFYPETFGEFDPERFPDVPADEQLFDRQRIADIVTGVFDR